MKGHIFRDRDGSTPLDPDQIQGLKFSHITTMAELDELEDANIQKGLDWLNHQKGDYLSTGFLKKLHKELFKDVWKWAGTFRKREVNLSKIPFYNVEVELHNLFKDASVWIENQSFSWDEMAAEFHHRLVSIHPFPNGNGRISRIMTEYFEKRNEKFVTNWKNSLLNNPEERRRQYIAALKNADRGDYRLLVEFMSEKNS